MLRKNNSESLSDAEAAANLPDDKEIVVTNTRTISKRTRKPPEPEPPPVIELDPDDDDDDFEIVNETNFPEGTIGFRAFGDENSERVATECNILVVRKPDGAGDNFLNKCGGRMSEPPIRNVNLNMAESEIEEMVRSNYGGGHYYLQTQFGNRNGRGWNASLADDPAKIALARAEQNPPAATVAPATPPVDPMAGFIANLQQTKMLKDLLFGDTEKQLRDEITRLRSEADAAKAATPTVEKSEKLTLLEMALETNKPEVTDRVLNSIFPSEEEGQRSTIAELAALALEHKDAILGLVGSLFGGAAAPAAPPNVMDALRSQAPPALRPRPSAFNRTAPPADPAPAETPPPAESEPIVTLAATDPNAPPPDHISETVIDGNDLTKGDETAIDAEITEETKAPAKRRGTSK